MKKIVLFATLIIFLSSCGSGGNGELIGVQDRKIWNPTDPYGMVFIPQGSFMMGPSDQDVPFANTSQARKVSIGAFYMDETEITNNEYRQFTNWVRDSIKATLLFADGMIDDDRFAIRVDKSMGEDDFYADETNITDPNDPEFFKLDWDEIRRYNRTNRWADEELRRSLRDLVATTEDGVEQPLFLRYNERQDGAYGGEEYNTRVFVYKYSVLDIDRASRKDQRQYKDYETSEDPKGKTDRNSFFVDRKIHIYPDTLCWTHDYAYAFNDPYTKNYFHHPAFDDYPVVGVDWHQAVAFCHWRTEMMNGFLRSVKEPTLPDFRLPTEAEWEYAARGGLEHSPYPWGGPYTRNLKGCFLANFKPLRGNYIADGGAKTIKVKSYNPNGYGLYDMSGNVAEWTMNSYDESALSYAHDINMYNTTKDLTRNQYGKDWSNISSEDDPEHQVHQRRVIRGGSWKDIAYFIQTSTRTFEYQDTSKSYIGFRCAVDFLGRDKKDFE